MKSFKQYINRLYEAQETNPVSVDTYHGSGHLFDKFDQKLARIRDDHYGGGVGYFTDDHDVGNQYARTMARTKGTGTPYVYHTNLNMNNVFDVDHKFSGDKLTNLLPSDPRKHEDFARGAGLLRMGGEDKYSVLSKLARGNLTLTGDQVFKGLSQGGVNTARARDHLISRGYDGIRYNGGLMIPGAKPHNVYMPYKADSITIKKVENGH